MAELDRQQLEPLLAQYIDPYLGTDLISAKCLRQLDVTDDAVSMVLQLGFPALGYHQELEQQILTLIQPLLGARQFRLEISTKIVAHGVQKGIKRLDNIKNIIAVASGKGGVGKSTTAVNLALALIAEGASVGILDADIYGPSIPRMLALSGKPDSTDGKSIEPKINHGLQAMSIGFLIDEETPMIWRGPMVTQALEQLLNDTRWRDLDYLIIDLPPGTGDTQLTLAQKVPLSGAVIVTTPQDIALLDARKGLKMFEKVAVPILGVVENMSTHVCSQCGHEESIFGSGGGGRMAEENKVALLGQLPLDIHIREQADSGTPTVVSHPDSNAALAYRNIARHMAAHLSLLSKDFSSKFPNIVIENN